MWYNSQGNSLSVSTQHSHLGKLGSKCRGHPVMHRQLPSHGDQPESQGSSKPSDMPSSTSIPPHKKLQVLTDKVYVISCNMKYDTWASSMH
ncbi:hypothetical protein HKD37_01G001675 [Glycine soja]